MQMTIFTANVLNREDNTDYPNKAVVTCAADMKRVQKHDHVCAAYKNNRRSNSNFISSDCIPMDVDNDETDNEAEWITPKKLDELLPDVGYAIVFSRHNMAEKNGKKARPKFHVYFPVHLYADADSYAAMKVKIQKMFPFFDPCALGAARFLYGSSGEVQWHDGSMNIDDFVTLNQPHEIGEGHRNAEMSHFAGMVLKRLGPDEAHEKFLEKAQTCNSPLGDIELSKIWNSALKFYEKISKEQGYIKPEDYEKTFLMPDDFSDLGEARSFVSQYNGEICYTEATAFLRFNGIYWVESKQKPVLAMMEHTDAQIIDAGSRIESAKSALESMGVDVHAAGKKLEKSLSGAELDTYQNFKKAQNYYNFVMKYRNIKSLKAAMESAMPFFEKLPDDLDSNPFLLTTPSYTYDLSKGLGGAREHRPEDYITKVTTSDAGEKGKDIWHDTLCLIFCGDTELIDYVQQIVGMAACGKVYLEALVIAYGESRNGKSTFWNTIARVLGSYAGNMSADALTAGCKRNVKPEMAELKGRRLIIAAELEEGMRLNTAVVKQLCSTDPIYAEKKYKAPFSFILSHTLVLYTNHLPKVGASDAGTWRRLIVIPFNAKIEGDSDIKNYADYLVQNASEAVMAWIIEGAEKAIKSNFTIKPPQIVKDAIETYREDNDWFGAFLENCCIVDESVTERSGEVYKCYREFCLNSHEFARSTTDFYAALDGAGFKRKRTSSGVIVRGLRIKTDFEENILQ